MHIYVFLGFWYAMDCHVMIIGCYRCFYSGQVASFFPRTGSPGVQASTLGSEQYVKASFAIRHYFMALPALRELGGGHQDSFA